MIGVSCREAHGRLSTLISSLTPRISDFQLLLLLCVHVVCICEYGPAYATAHVKARAGFWESLSVSTLRSRSQSQVMRLSAAEPSLAPKLVSFKAYEK